jgi:hypothetical protein
MKGMMTMAIKWTTQRLSREENRIREKITRRVGQTVLNFSSIENALGLMYSLSGGEHPTSAGKTFYVGKKFAEKIKLADAVTERTLSGEDLKSWRRLKNRLHDVARRRNHMAHLILVNHQVNRVVTPMLRQPWYKPSRSDVPSYALRDVEKVAADVDATRLDLWEFVRKVRRF